MNILFFYNDFTGAYNSIEVFQKEILCSVFDDRIYVSYCVNDTLEICKKINIDFSIAIGAFNQYVDDVPIYEITKIHHYQWIIDNPLKMCIDSKNELVTYVLINKDFIFNMNCYNSPLFIPLGLKCNSDEISVKRKSKMQIPTKLHAISGMNCMVTPD